MAILLLLLLLGILLSLPSVQSYLGKYATESINKSFGTNITIGTVAITPFGSAKLGEVLVLDHHKDTLFYIKKLNTSILSFKKIYNPGHPYLKNVIMHGLDVRIVNYKNENFTNLDKFIEAFDDGSPSSGNFRMKANKMSVFSSRFQYIDYNLSTPKMLDFTQLNGAIEDFFIKGATVTTRINKLSFQEHRGLKVENITSEFTYTKNMSGENPPDQGYDEDGNPIPGRGRDNYFNNGIYASGWTYFGKTIGSPYFTAMPVDENGITNGVILGDNRFMAFNVGVKGTFKPVQYKAMLSHVTYFGWFDNEYDPKPKQLSGLLELLVPQNTQGIPFDIALAASFDTGTYAPVNFGGFLTLTRRGRF